MPYQFSLLKGAPSIMGKTGELSRNTLNPLFNSVQNSLHRLDSKAAFEAYLHEQPLSPQMNRLRDSVSFQALRDSVAKQKKRLNLKLVREKRLEDFIPCLLMTYPGGSAKILLYFHANAEDLGRAYKFLTFVHTYLRMHVLAVEYPGYGIYTESPGGSGPSADKIIADAEHVYRFVREKLKWREEDILVCGRSIGSGPACYLASQHSPGALILVSPHTSIRGVVKDQLFGSITQYVIAERFRNVEAIAKVRCPTFILHGLRDTLVKPSHSQQLCDTCGGPTYLLLPETMDHNTLDIVRDFIAPLSEFLENFGIDTQNFPPLEYNLETCTEPARCQPSSPAKRGPRIPSTPVIKNPSRNKPLALVVPAAIQQPLTTMHFQTQEEESMSSHASSSEQVCDELDDCHTQIVEEDPVPRPPAIVLNPGFKYSGPQLEVDPVYLEKPAGLLKRARLFSRP